MGRKKKTDEKVLRVVEEDGGDEEVSSGVLHGDVKRSIAAVILTTFGILFALGFFESAGMLGSFFDRMSGLALGWGKWLFPFLLFVASVFLFRRRTGSWSDVIKLGGLFLAFVSLLGLFHFFQDGDRARLAASGGGGGYVGYGLSFLFGKLGGDAGGVTLFIAFFLVGTIAAFNVSLLGVAKFFRTRMEREGESSDQENAENENIPSALPDGNALPASSEVSVDTSVADSPSPPPTLTETEKLERENIKKLHFPDEAKKPSEKDDLRSVPAYFLSGEKKSLPLSPHRPPRKRRFWQLPTLDLLDTSDEEGFGGDTTERAEIIRQTLENFDIHVAHHDTRVGPTVTQYMFSPGTGVKLSRITALSDNLALALAAPSIRIQAPIPGKSLIGFEVPNQLQATVRLRNILESESFLKRTSPLTIVLGKDVHGEYRVADLGRMPHLLVAGTTRSGKSVFINSLLLSLLYQNAPDDLQLILIDPKRVELSLYNNIPHLITSVIVEPKKVVNALRSMTGEMERRYKLLEQVGSRDIESYHLRSSRGEKRTVSMPGGGMREEDLPRLPYIVIVIDEMADLMMAHGREVEGVIVRLAQMARAVGIHLVLATQRPSVEVITGLIKANIVSRVAFQVATQIDSRTILDQGGAEKLVGQGDMLFTTAGSPQPLRIQGPFVSEDEVRNVVEFLSDQKKAAHYREDIGADIVSDHPIREPEFALPPSSPPSDDLEAAPVGPDEPASSDSLHGEMMFSLEDTEEDEGDVDPRYEEAKKVVLEFRQASTSFLQRRMGLGYSRAAKLIDLLEQEGVIGPKDGAKSREILIASNALVATTPLHKEENDARFESSTSDDSETDKWRL